MSDGIIRICREHDVELRQLGTHLVCPHGHTCDTDWYLKTPAGALYPVAKPIPISTPISIPSTRTTKERPMEPNQPKKKRRVSAELAPHGTPQRYFHEVKRGKTCEACRKAANAYAKEKRAARLKASGGTPAPKGDTVQRRAPHHKTAKGKRASVRLDRQKGAFRVPTRTVNVPFVPASRPGDLETRIIRLREELAAAEMSFFHHVRAILPGVAMAGAAE